MRNILITSLAFLTFLLPTVRPCRASDEGAVLKATLKAVAESSFDIFGKQIDGLVRTFGAAGVTFIGTSPAGTPDRTSFGGGLQGMYAFGDRFLYIGVGIEAGYLHAYRETRRWPERPRRAHHDFGNALAVAEFCPVFILVQIGLGPYIDSVRTGKTFFGIMFAAGFNMPMKKLGAENIAMVFMTRADVLIDKRIPVPFRFFTGVTFYIPHRTRA